MARLKLETGPLPAFAVSIPEIKALVARLIPLPTAVESLGYDVTRFLSWLDKNPAIKTELKIARAKACIEMQEDMVKGKSGWQAKFRLLESLDPDTWIKRSGSAVRQKEPEQSPYAKALKKR